MADKIVMHTVTATNVSDRVHQLNAAPPIVIQPGESAEKVQISDAELEAAKHFGIFKFGAAAARAAEKDQDKREG